MCRQRSAGLSREPCLYWYTSRAVYLFLVLTSFSPFATKYDSRNAFEAVMSCKCGILRTTLSYRMQAVPGRMNCWPALLKVTHLKIPIGVSIKTPVHFTANAGFLVMMYLRAS